MNLRRRIRVGAVNYLNTKPLVFGLAELAPQAEIVFEVPSRLADDLASGRLDVALIPSVEMFHNRSYRIVSDACIACRGPVMSVKLLSRVPVERITTLALDEGSRTSVALVRILLNERFGLQPDLQPLPLGAMAGDADADAVLLIGDRAIHAGDDRSYAEVWDLGEEWRRWADLPFVFATWTAREGTDLGEFGEALRQSRDAGVAHLEEIAHNEAAGVGLSVEACLHYLRDHLHFDLGPRERRGLELFHRRAADLGLAPADWEPIFDEPHVRTEVAG